MTTADLDVALKKTQKVGWPHQMHDWQLHFDHGKGTVVCNKDNEIVATILWWPYGPNFATVGLVVVDEQCQGKGIGRLMMNLVIEQAGQSTLQLVATKSGMRLYEQCGFKSLGNIYQIQGIPDKSKLLSAPKLRQVQSSDMPALLAFDQQSFNGDRTALLTDVQKQATGVIVEQNQKITGYAFMRTSGRGQTIGPVVASNNEDAISLVNDLIKQSDNFVRLDLTDNATGLASWLATLNLPCVDTGVHMQLGNLQPPAKPEYIYSLVSQAFC